MTPYSETMKMKNYLMEGQPTPFNSIREIMHLASAIAATEDHIARLVWQDNNLFEYNGRAYTVDGFQKGIVAMVEDTEKFFFEEVLMGLELKDFGCEWDHIADALNKNGTDYNFLDDSANPFDATKLGFLNAVITHPELCHRFLLDSTDQAKYNEKGATRYLETCDTWRVKLYPSTHTTEGQPGRGEEEASTRIINCDRRRDVVVILSRLIILSSYSKSTSMSGQDKLIIRALHSRLARLLIIYLAWVRPFERYLLRVLGYREVIRSAFKTHLWVSSGSKTGIWDGDKCSRALSKAFLLHMNAELTIRDWRHISLAMLREFIMPHLERDISTYAAVLEAVMDAQAGHTPETASKRYAIVANSLKQLDSRAIRAFIKVSCAACLHEHANQLETLGK